MKTDLVNLSAAWTRLRRIQKNFKENLKMRKTKLVPRERSALTKLKVLSTGMILV